MLKGLELERFLDRGRIADIGVMNGVVYEVSRVDYDANRVYLWLGLEEITAKDNTTFYTRVENE